MKNPFRSTTAEAAGPVTSPPDPPVTTAGVTPDTPVVPAQPLSVLSDEGVRFNWLAYPDLIVNLATDAFDARRRELHISSRTFAHVAESLEGHWIYRCES